MREDERLKSVGRGSFGKIAAEIEQMVKAPDIRKQFLEMGAEPVGITPAQMAAQIKSELTSYEALAKQIKLVVE